MEEIALNRFMRLLQPLSSDLKLQLIARLSESIRQPESQQSDKEEWKKMFGVWNDVDDIDVTEIREARLSTREVPNLD